VGSSDFIIIIVGSLSRTVRFKCYEIASPSFNNITTNENCLSCRQGQSNAKAMHLNEMRGELHRGTDQQLG
jgi:hypothetical protein